LELNTANVVPFRSLLEVGSNQSVHAHGRGQHAREQRNPRENGAGGPDAERSALGIFAQRCPWDTKSG